MKNKYILYLCCFLLIISCNKNETEDIIPPDDNDPAQEVPDPVSNVDVENIPGGAIISYTLPDQENLDYVRAIINGNKEIRTTAFLNSFKIEGLGDTLKRQVQLFVVDRDGKQSEGVIVTISPLPPPVQEVGKSLQMYTSSGGKVFFYWENPLAIDVTIFIQQDIGNGFSQIYSYRTSQIDGEIAIEDLEVISANYQIFVIDSWGNQSISKFFTLTADYEVELEKVLFRELRLPGDSKDAWGWIMPKMWDGVVDEWNGFHTREDGKWPQSFTFDLGVDCIPTRLTIWQRPGGYAFRGGNIKVFEVYGSIDLATSDWEWWTKLGRFESHKPSGLPIGQTSFEDIEYVNLGEEYEFAPDSPKIRYLRFRILETWGNSRECYLSELSVFGDTN